MATTGYVDVVSTVDKKEGGGPIVIEAPPLTTGTPQTCVFKKYPVAVVKPIYVPATDDSMSCVNEETTKRIIAWITGISVEVKARQPYDVWATGNIRYDINGETYDSVMVFAAFENINYADLIDMAAIFKRYEPDNLILDEGRYPALDAFVPTPQLMSQVFSYGTKIQQAKAKNPDMKSWRHDAQPPRHAAPDSPEAAASSATPQSEQSSNEDVESYF